MELEVSGASRAGWRPHASAPRRARRLRTVPFQVPAVVSYPSQVLDAVQVAPVVEVVTHARPYTNGTARPRWGNPGLRAFGSEQRAAVTEGRRTTAQLSPTGCRMSSCLAANAAGGAMHRRPSDEPGPAWVVPQERSRSAAQDPPCYTAHADSVRVACRGNAGVIARKANRPAAAGAPAARAARHRHGGPIRDGHSRCPP